MKKSLFIALAIAALTSCNSNSGGTGGTTAKDVESDTQSKDFRGVENVNGNIPDTQATGATPTGDSTGIRTNNGGQ